MDAHTLLEKIFSSNQVQDESGNNYELAGNIDKVEGDYIFNLISNNKDIVKTLEVGCGYGISSLFICAALQSRENVKHTIIDPFQFSDYQGIGISNLKRIDCHFFELIQEPSEYALPNLTVKAEDSFDFIFIDGWHSFDHVLLDLFYANRLLRIGGYLTIDDCRLPSVAKAVTYFSKYPAYKIHSDTSSSNLSLQAKLARRICRSIPDVITKYFLPSTISALLNRLKYSSMLTFKKLGHDQRSSRWYSNPLLN